jgi:hypothetical protein
MMISVGFFFAELGEIVVFVCKMKFPAGMASDTQSFHDVRNI